MEYGAMLAALRLAKERSGLKLSEIDELGGGAPQNLSGWLSGSKEMRVRSLFLLADVLGLRVELVPKRKTFEDD